MSSLPTRQNQWFQPGEGIAREVITADIQRYLGNDALVRPGEGTGDYAGVQGYWITAYRNLTSQMVQDLRLDSQRWLVEIQQGRVAYQDSSTHRSRQYYGPSAPATASAAAPNTAEYAQPPQTQQRPYPAQPTHQVYAEHPSFAPQSAPTGYGQPQTYPPAYNQEQGRGGAAPAYTYTQQGQGQGQGQGQNEYFPSAQPPRYYQQQQPAAAPQGDRAYQTSQPSNTNVYYTADGRAYTANQPPQQANDRRRRQN